MNKKIIAGTAAFIGLALAATIVLAAPGDPVPPGTITTVGPGGTNCGGIGVAYDGTNILYTCASEAAVRKTDLTGANLGSVATLTAAGAPVSLDAIAWDTTDGKLWGGNLDGSGNCRIYETDLTTGVATLKFSFVDPHGGCNFSFFDGLTVDTASNTLWLSPDVHNFIHHYSKAGVEVAADLIDFALLTPAGEPDVNSGLAIGIDGSLFAGTNGSGKIVQLDPVAKTFTSVFATVSGRDEDLECGPVTNGLETILSRDFNSPKIDVLEAPKGTCKSPVQPTPTPSPRPTSTPTPTPSPSPDSRRMTGGGTIPAGTGRRITLEGKHGFELHCDKSVLPNNLEVNWGKGNKFHLETLTSASCSDDPKITPNPPAAGFDTYTGAGTGKLNGVSGATAKWRFTDAGEPGKNDYATISITDGVNTYNFSGNLTNGNQQAHK